MTGLYNLRARYYDPDLGRFLTRDTYPYGNPSELNRYVYAMGNPTNFADPNGEVALIVYALFLFAKEATPKAVIGAGKGALMGGLFGAISGFSMYLICLTVACPADKHLFSGTLQEFIQGSIKDGAIEGAKWGAATGAFGAMEYVEEVKDLIDTSKEAFALLKQTRDTGQVPYCAATLMAAGTLFGIGMSKIMAHLPDPKKNQGVDNCTNCYDSDTPTLDLPEQKPPKRPDDLDNVPTNKNSDIDELGRAREKDTPNRDQPPDNGNGKSADNEVGISCNMSFSADTVVTTEEGDVPIIELDLYDVVLAFDETSGTTGEYEVTATYVHLDEEIAYVTIDGETIETTPNHPFYTDEGEWVEAGELEVGEFIYRANGSYGEVEAIEIVGQPQPMYNLTVDEAHTYFVGDGQWVVHNNSKNCILTPKPGEIEGYSDRQTGKPDKWLQGIYEFRDQTRGNMWYVGSASKSSNLRVRLQQHMRNNRFSSFDEVVWTVIPGNNQILRIAEQIRIEQIASFEGGKQKLANKMDAWNLTSVAEFLECKGNEQFSGWPEWLYLP